MAATTSDQSFPLPAVTTALIPFLHPYNDIAAIRRQLWAHTQLVCQSDEAHSDDTLTGIRKSYVDAVREHQVAQKHWRATTDRLRSLHTDTLKSSNNSSNNNSQETGTEIKRDEEWLNAYDQVVCLRRRYERLTVAKKYLDEVLKKEKGYAGKLQMIVGEAGSSTPMHPHEAVKDGSVEDILLPLEKAVIDAADSLRREKELLARAEERRGKFGGEARVHALAAVKGELEVWLDGQLKQAGEGSATPVKKADGHGEEGDVDVQELVAAIQGSYDGYVASREALTAAASQSIKPPLSTQEKPADDEEDISSVDKARPKKILRDLLPHLEPLISTHQTSRSLHAQSTALSNTVSTSEVSLSQTLDRLRSESRLLDEYPPTGATPKKRRSMFGEDIEQHKESESMTMIKHWKHAADEARLATNEAIKEDLKTATDRLDGAEEELKQIQLFKEGKDGKGILGRLDGKIGVVR